MPDKTLHDKTLPDKTLHDKTLRSIVVGSSLEPQSDPVVETARTLAEAAGAGLRLIHGYTPPLAYFAAPTGLAAFDADLLDAAEKAHRAMLDDQLARLEIDRSSLTAATILSGAPHRLILEEVRERPTDLVVVGSRESDLPRWMGSTSDRVVRQSTAPVLVVREGSAVPPRRVLAPVDLSSHSEDSLKRGLALLETLGGDPQITVLFVLSETGHKSPLLEPEQIQRMAHEELDRFIDRVDPERRHRLSPELRLGEPRREIVRDLEENAAEIDLVLLGTHGRGGFERLILGSVAADVVERSPVSALIVPPMEAEA